MTDQQTDTAPTTDPAATHPPGFIGGDSDGHLQDGDFGLDGDLRKMMVDALEGTFSADDTQDDAATADAAVQPDPAPIPPVTGGESGAGEGQAGGEGAAPDPSASPPASDDFSLDQYATEYFGTNLSRDQARELFGVLGGLQALTPEQRAQVDAAIAGGQRDVYPATMGQPPGQPQPQPAPQPQPQPAPDHQPAPGLANLPPRPPDDDYEAQRLYDQYIAPLAASTQQQLAAIQQDQERLTRAQLQRQQQDYDTQISAASNAWRAQYPMVTDGEFDALTDRIIRDGTFPAYANLEGPAGATTKMLEQYFWGDPQLRARALANVASGRLATDATQLDPSSRVAQDAATVTAERQARAASVAGGGGAATPRGDQQPVPTDAAGRKRAMIAELAQMEHLQT